MVDKSPTSKEPITELRYWAIYVSLKIIVNEKVDFFL